MSTGLFRSSPRTSYLKAIDVFLLVCFSFSVVVLVVFCSVIYLNGEEKAKKVVRVVRGRHVKTLISDRLR